MILFLEKKWGIHYALGGTGKIIEALETLMNEEGIKIYKNSEVEEILTEDKANFGEEFMRHIVLGLEFLITKNLNFRLGYNNRNRNEMMILDRKAMVGFSYGFSFKLNRFKFNYGRSLNHFSGPVNSLGITTNISSF